MNAAHRSAPLRLGVLFSGGGRTVLNLLDRIEAGTLDATIVRAIASRHDAPGIARLQARGIEVAVAARADFTDERAMHDWIDERLLEAAVELVCLCGYLRPFRVTGRTADWSGRVMNIHPALLPAFGGKGMYGDRVHAAVLASGARESGCTVHFVDEHYDQGPIILQRRCPVYPGEDVPTLAARVFIEECEAYPDAIARFASGELSPNGCPSGSDRNG